MNIYFSFSLGLYISVVLLFVSIVKYFFKGLLTKIILTIVMFLSFSLLFEYFVLKKISDGYLLIFILLVVCYLTIILVESFYQKETKSKFSLLISSLLTIITGVSILSLYFWKTTNTSIFEGHIIIMWFVLFGFTSVLSILNFLLIKYNKSHLFPRLKIETDREKKYNINLRHYSSFLLLLIILSCIFAYITGLDQINEMGHMNQIDEFYLCFEENSTGNQRDLSNKSTTKKEDIIEILKTQKEKDATVLATLYLLSNEKKWGELFKEKLVNLAMNEKFTGSTGGDKAQQIRAGRRLAYYLEIKEKDPTLFSSLEKELIENWFEKVNQNIYRVEWIDWAYGFFFKKIPDGPYENQEIGVGSLAIFSDFIKERNSNLYQKNKKYIDKFAVGFKGNFRNPDDNFYYQGLWVRNAYFLMNHDRRYYNQNNLQKSLEWMLLQYPPTGQAPFYNDPYDPSSFEMPPLDVCTLAQYLTGDGRYKWVSERIVDYISQHREKINFREIYGLQFWDENLEPIKPKVELCFLQGSTGIAQKPGSLKPDKIIFRDGWDKSSFYALLNLRFSGWHSYPASNSLTTVIHKEPFIVDNLAKKNKFSLFNADRFYNDRKIDRIDLNAFQLKSSGLQLMLHRLTGIPSIWRNDPPKFSSLDYFNSTNRIEYSRTSIEDWHNWSHNRTVALKKNGFFVILDHAIGKEKDDIAVSWHLRGNNKILNNSVISEQNDTTMLMFFPHSKNWYEVDRKEVDECPKSYINCAQDTLYFFSRNKNKTGFITLFYPKENFIKDKVININYIDVKRDDNLSAFPYGLGIKMNNMDGFDIVGSNIRKDILNYKDLKTDASFFLFTKKENAYNISFTNMSMIEFNTENAPSSIELSGKRLKKDEDWIFRENRVIIDNIKTLNGEFKIYE